MASVNLLERNVRKILDSAGFNPELRKKIDSYEVDVYFEYETLEVVFECKQYEKSNLTVRNLIHQWSGKQDEIGVDKVVLVLVGVSITEDDLELAEDKGIEIWDGEDVERLLNKAVDEESEFKDIIFSEIGLSGRDEVKEEVRELSEDEVSQIRSQLRESTGAEGNVLNKRDREKLYRGGTYYGTKFVEVVNQMIEYGIEDKKRAYLIVDNQGGTYDGENYPKTKVKRIKKVMEELNYSFEEAEEIVDSLSEVNLFDGYYPTKKFVNRAVKVKKSNKDISFIQIKKAFDADYTVRDLKDLEDASSLDIRSPVKSEGIQEKVLLNAISILGTIFSIFLFYIGFQTLFTSITIGLVTLLTALVTLSLSLNRYLSDSEIDTPKGDLLESMVVLWIFGIVIAGIEFIIRFFIFQ